MLILFDKTNLKYSNEKDLDVPNNILEMWECEKDCEDKPFKDGTFDGSERLYDLKPLPRNWKYNNNREKMKGWIDTDMSDPFYAFRGSDDYYFVTISGKIYVAPHASVDAKDIARLTAELDSDAFPTREKAMHGLRAIGKPAQPALETRFSKSTSLEQRRRIGEILNELKPLPERKTKLLWHDECRPVDKLLFDQDKNKVYAFTKPNKEKQVYFFEITDKPQPRLFTGNIAPDSPASLPASTRLFLEYARFVRKGK